MTTCEHCEQPIFPNRLGTWSHVGNTTPSPETCYAGPGGSQRQASPSMPVHPGQTVMGPFGPNGYTVLVTEVEVASPGEYFVTGIRSDKDEDYVREMGTGGVVSFLWPANRIHVLGD